MKERESPGTHADYAKCDEHSRTDLIVQQSRISIQDQCWTDNIDKNSLR